MGIFDTNERGWVIFRVGCVVWIQEKFQLIGNEISLLENKLKMDTFDYFKVKENMHVVNIFVTCNV